MMPNRMLECSQIDLRSLLAEKGGDGNPALTHLECCPKCQRHLESLAASEEWWRDCQTHLGVSAAGGEPPPGNVRHDTAWLADDFAGVLAPPSHPEMLGRMGRYEVEKLLGHGGMGVVFKAFDTELHRPVAIKVLAPHLAGSGAAKQRFGREARAAAAVVHEHVVAIHDVETSANPPYLVMQYVHGESLQAYVDRHGPLEMTDLIRIGHQIAAGLAAAHEQGLVHRDIKPGNIMLENGLGKVVITDFGLARAADDASLTHSGIVAGTPHYMAPEQARGEPSDARSDLFSLGAVMYFMATGHPPFRAERAMAVLHRICHDRQRPLGQVNPNISDELTSVIDRLLEKKPSRRFGSASEVQRVLAGVLNDIRKPGGRKRRRWLAPLKRKRLYWAIAVLCLFVTVIATASFITRQQSVETTGRNAGDPNASEVLLTGTAASETADAIAGQPDFLSEAAAINHALGQVETRQFPESSMSVRDSWKQNLSAVLKDIGRLERSWPASHENDSNPNEGEMP